MSRASPTGPTELLDQVAQQLHSLLPDLVFVGGSTVGLLITDPAAEQPRVTRDVDAAARVASRPEFWRLEERFRALGFEPDTSEGAPICRWVKGALIVDLLTDDAQISGFTNPWYASAIDTARPLPLPSGLTVQVVDGPHLIATKLVAWRDRGQGNWYSHDLEDIMLVLDGRPELPDELRRSPAAVRAFVAQEFRALLQDPEFADVLPGFLSGDQATQQRVPLLLARIREISRLDDEAQG